MSNDGEIIEESITEYRLAPIGTRLLRTWLMFCGVTGTIMAAMLIFAFPASEPNGLVPYFLRMVPSALLAGLGLGTCAFVFLGWVLAFISHLPRHVRLCESTVEVKTPTSTKSYALADCTWRLGSTVDDTAFVTLAPQPIVVISPPERTWPVRGTDQFTCGYDATLRGQIIERLRSSNAREVEARDSSMRSMVVVALSSTCLGKVVGYAVSAMLHAAAIDATLFGRPVSATWEPISSLCGMAGLFIGPWIYGRLKRGRNEMSDEP